MTNPTVEVKVETLTPEEHRVVTAYRQMDDVTKRLLWTRFRAIQNPPEGISTHDFTAFMEGFSYSEEELDAMEDTLQSLRRLPEDRELE